MKLPEELGKLYALEELNISFLGLDNLPKSFSQLDELQILDISFNTLNIENEIESILGLKNLRILKIFGCKITEPALSRLRREKPELKIYYSYEQYMNELKIKRSE